jgi:hypothetical protein
MACQLTSFLSVTQFLQAPFRRSCSVLPKCSCVYHPQSDGQTERVNQCLKTYLRCFIHSCPRQWSKWLPLAEYWYNTCFHSALGRSPFEVLYGHPPWYFGITDEDVSPVPDVASLLAERETMLSAVRQHLLRTQ